MQNNVADLTVASDKKKKRNGSIWRNVWRNKALYLMIIPGAIFTFVFSYLPLTGLYMAFSSYKLGKPIWSAEFVGLKYIIRFLKDTAQLLPLLYNTIGMNLLSLFIGLTAAMLFAVLLNEIKSKPLKKIVQTSSFFPFFISWVIVYNIFNTFLAVESGIINVALKKIGLISDGINFLGQPKYAWLLIIISNLWKSLGYNSILFLSAIAAIDSTHYEAAYIDGADRLQSIWNITLPFLLPTFQVLLVLNAGWIFSSNFDQFYLFTNQLNKPKMLVLDLYIYDIGLKQFRYSYATAVGIVKSIAGIFTLYLVNRVSRRVNETSVF